MKNPVNELKFKRAGLLDEADKALTAGEKATYEAKMSEVKSLNSEIEARQNLDAEMGRFGQDDHEMVNRADILKNQAEDKQLEANIDQARSGKEYVRAFVYALKNGITPKRRTSDEAVRPLFNALTIAGGSPAGADGGFLVPVEMDNMIREVKRDFSPISQLFDNQTVGAATGWRAKDAAPTTGFTKITGGEYTTLTAAQPSFAKVEYSLDTYGLYIPMGKELLDDEAGGLMQYLSRWIGKKEVITENSLLLALLIALTETDLTSGSEIKGIKTVLNKTLDPAISANARVICNQSAFDLLDALEDVNGRPLLMPDVTNQTQFKLIGRPVKTVADAFLPNTGSPASKAPIYIGDFSQFATLFRRGAVEVAGTDVGGDAWRNYGYEMRAVTRLDAVVFDTDAVKGVNFTF